ncbi:MAG: thiolase family protein [Halioglobus sp.]|nr:thiolase family protein [Halioglobus sp.]
MGRPAVIAGIGMTCFGKFMDRNIKQLAGEAINDALKDAAIEGSDLQAAYMGNAAASVIAGQVCVPGQIILRDLGIGKIPVLNLENACASAATAFNQAVKMIELGAYDIVLACGYEKLYSEDKAKTFSVFTGAVDVTNMEGLMSTLGERMAALGVSMDSQGAGSKRSLFMDIYAAWSLEHMQKYGTTQEQFAAVAAKNSFHGSLNPRAQYREPLTVSDVLAAPEICYPLTLPMCSPIGDGAAAVVLMSEAKARELGVSQPVKVESTVLMSGFDYDDSTAETVTEVAAIAAYEAAGIGPEDVDVVELHDASAPSEIFCYEYLGLCPQGEGGAFVEAGHSRLGGKLPVNTSGGLLRKGHPIGATGIGQIFELTEQLRGRCGERQVEGARVALAENGGGFVQADAAAMVVSVLSI